MTQEAAVQFWLVSAARNHVVANSNFSSKHYDWALFFWHLVIEKSLKAIISQIGETPIATHNLLKLAKQAQLELPENYKEHFREITGFNLEARYDDYKFSFYKKATRNFAIEWIAICEEVYQWLLQKHGEKK
ncbi:MAG: HEPN domain-containing protein [bacterium]|nr:HEPN domain-containing protein [bacterium]